jgi:hypothetical protein
MHPALRFGLIAGIVLSSWFIGCRPPATTESGACASDASDCAVAEASSPAKQTTSSESTAQCPVCGKTDDLKAFHYACQSVVSDDPDVVCKECGTVAAGTFCPTQVRFHFSDEKKSGCGTQIGAFCTYCQDLRGWPMVGYCQTCRRPAPKYKPCPSCDEWIDDQEEYDPSDDETLRQAAAAEDTPHNGAVAEEADSASQPVAESGARCPECGKAGDEGRLCADCKAIFTTEGSVTCELCGKVKSGTWCAERLAFHFSDDGSKCCGKRRGEWDNDYGCAIYVGLDWVYLCEECELPVDVESQCPRCSADDGE